MKIRRGYVSNSSSSSFVIVGISINVSNDNTAPKVPDVPIIKIDDDIDYINTKKVEYAKKLELYNKEVEYYEENNVTIEKLEEHFDIANYDDLTDLIVGKSLGYIDDCGGTTAFSIERIQDAFTEVKVLLEKHNLSSNNIDLHIGIQYC